MKDCNLRPAWDSANGCSCRPLCPPPENGCGGAKDNFLMQRILGSGRLHRRCQLYQLQPLDFPCQAAPPLQIVNATVDRTPAWEEAPCAEKGTMLLRVDVPLLLRLRDRQGCFHDSAAFITEDLRLRLCCPEQECWRGNIFLQAAARLCGNACPWEGKDCCPVRLEVLLDGFLLLPCPAFPPVPACPPNTRPWYPPAPF